MTSTRFALLVATLGEIARHAGLSMPGFRSPPRRPGCTRGIRWQSTGEAIIAVAISGRAEDDVVRDMIDGVAIVNRLSSHDSAKLCLDVTAVLFRSRASPAQAA